MLFFCVFTFFVKTQISQRQSSIQEYTFHISREFVSAKLGRLNGGISNISGARLNENIGTRRGSSINSKDRVVKAKLSFRPWLEYLPCRKKVFDEYELIFHTRETYYTPRYVETVARLFCTSQSGLKITIINSC